MGILQLIQAFLIRKLAPEISIIVCAGGMELTYKPGILFGGARMQQHDQRKGENSIRYFANEGQILKVKL